jgi:hypothetical protein
MLFSRSRKSEQHESAVLVDIGGQNVRIAIVSSGDSSTQIRLLWTHHEIVNDKASSGDEKAVCSAVSQAFKELGTNGFATLRKIGQTDLPSLIQVSIASPYVYTVSRNVSLKADAPVRITERLVAELEKKAVDEIRAQTTGDLFARNLNLAVVSNSTAALSVNGYPTQFPFKSTAKEITLCQVVALGARVLVDHIRSCQEKILPEAVLDIDSFMSLYLRALSELGPKVVDACLVFVSDTTTELLVQRDGLPQSVLSMPGGYSTISNSLSTSTTLTDIKQEGTPTAKLTSYEEGLVRLFGQTNDGLSLPKNIYLHAKTDQSRVFAAALQRSSRSATGTDHQIFSAPATFFSSLNISDPDWCCLAFVYHRKLYEDRHLIEMKNMLK